MCIYICVCVAIYVCVCRYIYVYMCVCRYIYMCVCARAMRKGEGRKEWIHLVVAKRTRAMQRGAVVGVGDAGRDGLALHHGPHCLDVVGGNVLEHNPRRLGVLRRGGQSKPITPHCITFHHIASQELARHTSSTVVTSCAARNGQGIHHIRCWPCERRRGSFSMPQPLNPDVFSDQSVLVLSPDPIFVFAP